MSEFVKAVSGSFFTDEQKKAKAEIMHVLMDTYFDCFKQHEKLFRDPQMLSDLVTSILVMFTREILVHYIHCFNLESHRKDVLKAFCDTIRNQVNERIKENMQ
jgi:hypothetical protein